MRVQPNLVASTQNVWSQARRSLGKRTEHLLGQDFEERVATLRRRYEARGGDPFGCDLEVIRGAARLCALFHRLYFRTECHGLKQLPEGRLLLVANHSGQLPIDAVVIGCAFFLDADPPRLVRAMVDKWAMTLPYISTFFARLGQVAGLPENARRLLQLDETLLTFPEGIRGISKPFSRRYQLEDFGTGFMRLALSTQTPIVPIGVVGAEEQYISFGNLRSVARALGMPVFPLVPQVLLPLGQLPLPVKYHLHFGEPMHFTGDPDAEQSEIAEKVGQVRGAIQGLLTQGLQQRRGVFV